MSNIGQKLRDRREELELSLEDVSNKTKISVKKLAAIEENNLQALDEDLSYVKFYVRNYCQVLHLNFEDFRDELSENLLEHTQTISLLQIKEREEINNSIKTKAKASSKKNIRKIDYSFVSLISVIVVLIVSLIFIFTTYVLPTLSNNELDVDPVPPVVVVPDDEEELEEPIIDEVKSDVSIEAVDPQNYTISNLEMGEQLSIKTVFAQDTWTRVLFDGVATDNPKESIYNNGDEIEVLINYEKDMIVTIHLGYVRGNQIYINDELYELDASVKDVTDGRQIHFHLKGEQ